jgi:tetratricopeptide (TPR) repeat protein
VAANPTHPSLIDQHHVVPELYNTRNVPAAFWIDEQGIVVRANDPIYIQRRNRETGESTVNEHYLAAVRDWVEKGAESIYVTSGEETTRRMGAHDPENAQANAHFRLGVYLHEQGHPEAAVEQFKRAHELKPDNWNYKRQAWNLGDIEQNYGMTMREAFSGDIPLYPPLELPEPPAE